MIDSKVSAIAFIPLIMLEDWKYAVCRTVKTVIFTCKVCTENKSQWLSKYSATNTNFMVQDEIPNSQCET